MRVSNILSALQRFPGNENQIAVIETYQPTAADAGAAQFNIFLRDNYFSFTLATCVHCNNLIEFIEIILI